MIAFIVIFGGNEIFLITDGIIILCDSQATGTGDIALIWLYIRSKKKKEEEKN